MEKFPVAVAKISKLEIFRRTTQGSVFFCSVNLETQTAGVGHSKSVFSYFHPVIIVRLHTPLSVAETLPKKPDFLSKAMVYG